VNGRQDKVFCSVRGEGWHSLLKYSRERISIYHPWQHKWKGNHQDNLHLSLSEWANINNAYQIHFMDFKAYMCIEGVSSVKAFIKLDVHNIFGS